MTVNYWDTFHRCGLGATGEKLNSGKTTDILLRNEFTSSGCAGYLLWEHMVHQLASENFKIIFYNTRKDLYEKEISTISSIAVWYSFSYSCRPYKNCHNYFRSEEYCGDDWRR
jgi:hypothetical protein